MNRQPTSGNLSEEGVRTNVADARRRHLRRDVLRKKVDHFRLRNHVDDVAVVVY